MNDDLVESLYKRFHNRTLEIEIGELLRVAPQLRHKLLRELPDRSEGVLNAIEAWQPSPLEGENLEYENRVSEPVNIPMNAVIPLSNLVRDNRYSVPANDDEKKRRDMYSLGLLHTHVYVKDFALKTMIDSGSGVDAMPLDVAQRLRLKIRPKPYVRMVPVGGADLVCYGCVEDLPVSIGDISITINVFVLELCPTELLLGRPYMQKSMMALIQQPNGGVECRVHSTDKTRRCTFIVYRPCESKITRAKALWPEDHLEEYEDELSDGPLNY